MLKLVLLLVGVLFLLEAQQYFVDEQIPKHLQSSVLLNDLLLLREDLLKNKSLLERENLHIKEYNSKMLLKRDYKYTSTPKQYESEAKYYIGHAAASYCSNRNLENWNCIAYCKTKKLEKFVIFEDETSGGKCYLGVDRARKAIILTFRGSINIRNWIQNFRIFRTNIPELNSTSALVHKGFLYSSRQLFNLYISNLRSLVKSKDYKNYKLVLVGHSLGGAIASISSILIQSQLKLKPSKIEIFTYGQPRIGSEELIEKIKDHTGKIIRTVNKNDIVASVPFTFHGYQHHLRELWIKQDKGIVLCREDVVEDPACSLSLTLKSILAHITIWSYAFGLPC